MSVSVLTCNLCSLAVFPEVAACPLTVFKSRASQFRSSVLSRTLRQNELGVGRGWDSLLRPGVLTDVRGRKEVGENKWGYCGKQMVWVKEINAGNVGERKAYSRNRTVFWKGKAGVRCWYCEVCEYVLKDVSGGRTLKQAWEDDTHTFWLFRFTDWPSNFPAQDTWTR